jgi:MFS family permease
VSDVTETATIKPGGWRDLLGRERFRTSTLLAGGVGLYATNEFLTISLLPSTVADIGGQRFYAWVIAVYLVGSVVAASAVNPLLVRFGPRMSYLLTLAIFGVGTLGCALAPTMELLLVARTVQGAAGGMLAGLGYAVISSALPQRLWTRASALVSAMWGVSVLIGPAMGGIFAQLGIWRWAFGSLVIATAAMTALVPGALPARRPNDTSPSAIPRIPVWSLLLLGAAALAVSVAGVQRAAVATFGLLAVGAGLVALFLVVDRRTEAMVLPRAAFRPGSLKWMYVTVGLLMAATMVDMYVPLYAQHLAGMVPAAAGFFGAVLAIGWTASEIASASASRTKTVVRLVAFSPVVMALGLALGALVLGSHLSWPQVVAWAVGLFIAGCGVGIAWPHLSAWIMGAVDDPVEAGTAAAAINTVQLISGAFGAGLAGVVVNITRGGDAVAARWLFAVFAVLAAVGLAASYRASRGRLDPAPSPTP